MNVGDLRRVLEDLQLDYGSDVVVEYTLGGREERAYPFDCRVESMYYRGNDFTREVVLSLGEIKTRRDNNAP
jgi:hypothetical protein